MQVGGRGRGLCDAHDVPHNRRQEIKRLRSTIGERVLTRLAVMNGGFLAGECQCHQKEHF